MELYNTFNLEQSLLKKYKKYKIEPIYKFPGCTEVFKFSNDTIEEIKERINNA